MRLNSKMTKGLVALSLVGALNGCALTQVKNYDYDGDKGLYSSNSTSQQEYKSKAGEIAYNSLNLVLLMGL